MGTVRITKAHAERVGRDMSSATYKPLMEKHCRLGDPLIAEVQVVWYGKADFAKWSELNSRFRHVNATLHVQAGDRMVEIHSSDTFASPDDGRYRHIKVSHGEFAERLIAWSDEYERLKRDRRQAERTITDNLTLLKSLKRIRAEWPEVVPFLGLAPPVQVPAVPIADIMAKLQNAKTPPEQQVTVA